MTILKQSTQYNRSFAMISSTDHIAGVTGQSSNITLVLYKGGSTSSSTFSGTIKEQGNGLYVAQLSSVDTAILGDLSFNATIPSGGDPTTFIDQVQSQVFTDLVLDANNRVKISNNLTQNSALNPLLFAMTDAGTGARKTGLTVTAQRTLGAGGFASCANAVSEIGATGIYSINLAATDLNAATIGLLFTAASANDVFIPLVPTP